MKIVPFEPTHHDDLVAVWERSVRATHSFVSPDDLDHFKVIVSGLDFSAFSVFCLMEENTLRGFLGVADRKVEMLFLDPQCIGMGLGKMLMNFALESLHADRVDVNEQNTHAVSFYKSFGFSVYERTEKDAEGKDYPILKMKRD